jgi:Uma2 family endonuclease
MQTTRLRWTIADLVAFPDNDLNRYEIIDGELFVTKSPHWNHQSSCARISRIIGDWAEKTGLGDVAIAPGIIFSDADNVIPDVVWVSNQRLELLMDTSGHLTGAPELVIEVLSPGEKNVIRDKEKKLLLYSQQGVEEYWICNYIEKTVEVYRSQLANLQLKLTLLNQDQLTSPLLPGFNCLVNQLFP